MLPFQCTRTQSKTLSSLATPVSFEAWGQEAGIPTLIQDQAGVSLRNNLTNSQDLPLNEGNESVEKEYSSEPSQYSPKPSQYCILHLNPNLEEDPGEDRAGGEHSDDEVNSYICSHAIASAEANNPADDPPNSICDGEPDAKDEAGDEDEAGDKGEHGYKDNDTQVIKRGIQKGHRRTSGYFWISFNCTWSEAIAAHGKNSEL
ncbi:hypothetical protein GALMADRAFT_133953 [Galerina marginata CBS 339.88]|uniref:Uncharacterized protein n=1 Tax=Galerina marginata (strain CBS 339.88) TaxID=685588 RepID=A0A067TQW3_GALM3|nr:hypothetical protein GALMADRAFT_133953 [Galerina marginata CBS 339.88]